MTRVLTRTLALTALVALSSLAACDSQPTVCEDLAALRDSVSTLRDTSLAQDGVDAVRSQLQDVQDQVDTLAEDASQTYAPQIAAVRDSASKLEAGLESAADSPSGQTLTGLADEVRSFAGAVDTLTTAVSTTCD